MSEKKRWAIGFWSRHTVRVAALVLIAAAVLSAGAFGLKSLFATDGKTTRLGFEDIGQLATQAAYCTEVKVAEKSAELWGLTIPFTQSKYIYSYDVEVKAGFDFGAITWSVKVAKASSSRVRTSLYLSVLSSLCMVTQMRRTPFCSARQA